MWDRDYDPCGDGIDGCERCLMDDHYNDCESELKFTREEIEEK